MIIAAGFFGTQQALRKERVETGLRSFCSAAVQRKKKIKTPEDYKAFVDWLFEQERVFEKLCEEMGEV